VFGAVIAQGRDYRETFQVFRPGFDLTDEREKRAEAGKPEWFGEDDLYSDVRPALRALREAGLWVGIAGNQTVRAGGLLRGLDLPTDMIATSDDWGASKPDVKFFEHVIDATRAVGDDPAARPGSRHRDDDADRFAGRASGACGGVQRCRALTVVPQS
jgi:FMN phosphatase YigB (HAD superfamily)